MDNDNNETKTPNREPYEPPQVVESGRFEHLVLACGQGPSNVIPDCFPFPANWTS